MSAEYTYSFDVFDTVLTRDVLHPKDVFHLVQQSLPAKLPDLPGQLHKCFWGARVWSEFLARRRSSREDISLGEIYDALARFFGLNSAQRDRLMNVELDIEESVLVPIHGAASLLNGCRRNTAGIVFLSDMYLPSHFIRKVLEESGLFLPGDRLFVSGEVGLTKGSGNLFRHILEMDGLKPGQLIHCGDHPLSDTEVPRSLGMKILHENRSMKNSTLLSSLSLKIGYLRELVQARRQISGAHNV